MEKGEDAVWGKKILAMSRHGGMGEHGVLQEPQGVHHTSWKAQHTRRVFVKAREWVEATAGGTKEMTF